MRSSARGRLVASVAAALLVIALCQVNGGVPASAAGNASLTGTVVAAGAPIAGSEVTLYGGGRLGATALGTDTTDATGAFAISFEPTNPISSVLYVVARGGAPTSNPSPTTSPVHLVATANSIKAGAAPLPNVTVNELTTVATAFALAQFIEGDTISGPDPGLSIATNTVSNLVNPATGTLADVVTNADNAGNSTAETLNTLANALAPCTTAAVDAPCDVLRSLATPPGGPTPATTFEVATSVAHNPSLSRADLQAWALLMPSYQPALTAPPEAWLVALHHTAPELYAPGRMAFDASGNVWVNNNWLPGTNDSSPYIHVLSPMGDLLYGSPISGGGVDGAGFGAAIDVDGSFWVGNFGGSSVSKFSSTGEPLSPPTGWTNGDPLHPQTVAVDRQGNVWIASNGGTELDQQGSVIVYPGGDPTKAVTLTNNGIYHPFSVQVDSLGRAWVTNAGAVGGSVSVFGPDLQPLPFSPIEDIGLASPKGLAFDSQGNAWVSSFENNNVVFIHADGTVDPASPFTLPGALGPWGISVDGRDRVFVAGFAVPGVWQLCGIDVAACPPGSKTGDVLSTGVFGFGSESLQKVTAVQVDSAGNVWAANNWSSATPPTGGDGLVEFVGLAAPVCTPLLGQPIAPTTATAQSCPTFSKPVPPTPVAPAAAVAATPAYTA